MAKYLVIKTSASVLLLLTVVAVLSCFLDFETLADFRVALRERAAAAAPSSLLTTSAVEVQNGSRGRQPLGEASGRDSAENMMVSSIECVDVPGYNQTCLAKNVYLMDDPAAGESAALRLYFTRKQFSQTPQISLQAWGVPGRGSSPYAVRTFRTQEALEAAAKARGPLIRRRGLHLLYRASWLQNWVHATLDALYAAYVGLAKFKRHMDNYTVIVELTDHRTCPASAKDMTCEMERAFTLFSSWGATSEGSLLVRENGPQKWRKLMELAGGPTVFDELIIGSGHSGQYSAVHTLPSSRHFRFWPQKDGLHDEGVLTSFVDRYYRSMHLPMLSRRSGKSNADRSTGGKLVLVITSNKRFTRQKTELLKKTVALCSASSKFTCKFVDFGMLGPRWAARMRIFGAMDIHVSGTGTGLFNHIWLPHGSVTINLGSMEKTPAGIIGYPSYGEEFLGMSHSGAKMIYAPLSFLTERRTASQYLNLFDEAAGLILAGFSIPTSLHPEDCYSVFGQMVHELSLTDEQSHQGLYGWMPRSGGRTIKYTDYDSQKAFDCPHEYPADIVYESERAVRGCNINWARLRALKVKYGLKELLHVEKDCGQCVVCAECGKFEEISSWKK